MIQLLSNTCRFVGLISDCMRRMESFIRIVNDFWELLEILWPERTQRTCRPVCPWAICLRGTQDIYTSNPMLWKQLLGGIQRLSSGAWWGDSTGQGRISMLSQGHFLGKAITALPQQTLAWTVQHHEEPKPNFNKTNRSSVLFWIRRKPLGHCQFSRYGTFFYQQGFKISENIDSQF